MRALITGASGFVGGHLSRRLGELGHAVIPAGRGDLDALPLDGVDTVFHLAGSRLPDEVHAVNVDITMHVLEQIVATRRAIRVVVVGSSAIYGGSDQPLTESAPIAPVTPYGASKAAADQLAHQVFVASGLPVMRARPFNIIGPGQRGDYFVPACAKQLVEIARGAPSVLRLGNLDGVRDFIDVRDVADGLIAVALRGTPGEAYNVCSGVGTRVRDIVDRLIQMMALDVTVETRPAQSSDVPVQIGSSAKLAALGWTPRHGIALRDIVAAYS